MRNFGKNKIKFSKNEINKISKTILSLPCSIIHNEAEIELVCEVMNGFQIE